jgi:hypothetical protein
VKDEFFEMPTNSCITLFGEIDHSKACKIVYRSVVVPCWFFNADPDPELKVIADPGLMTKNCLNVTIEKILYFIVAIFFILRPL